jgi:caffeoyl-CoA O-methyltransferase
MRKMLSPKFSIVPLMLCLSLSVGPGICEDLRQTGSTDEKVKNFLQRRQSKWRDWNVSYSDGKFLYDLIIKNKYKKALEIGTSTGHSAIWIAWALSKTEGKLITIEIDKSRYEEALDNFEKVGLSDYIDSRLANAHELVKELNGPFDFIFSDADKDWYKNYFLALAPKLEVGGCFAAHNVSWTYHRGIKEFLDYVYSLPNFETTINQAYSEDISLSFKRAEN